MLGSDFINGLSGALVGALARVDSLAAFSEGYALGVPTSPESIRLALLALLGIFIYGFFKFTWTLRQYNYCIAMIGAAPMPPIETERPHSGQVTWTGTRIFSSAGFNRHQDRDIFSPSIDSS